MMLKNVYRVGGYVRDTLLGLEPKDIDYVVIGETPEIMIALGFNRVGEFPVFLHPETHDEYALGRTEKKTGIGHTGFDTYSSPDVTLEEDLARRDLTINAMAMDDEGNIIDPFNGQQDLKDKILRHTTDAFAEDPLRVLRVARFLARFGEEWTIHPDTQDLMMKIYASGELTHLTPERIWKETEKALGEATPEAYFYALDGFGIFPEIEAMHGVTQSVLHHPEGDVFIHTMLVLRRAADLRLDTITRFAALCHDFGKPVTFSEHGTLHRHEQAGVEVIKAFCLRLKVPNIYRDTAVLTSDNHTRSHRLLKMTPKKVFALVFEKMDAERHQERFERFLSACQCDAQGRGETFVNKPYYQADMLRKVLSDLMRLDKKTLAQELMAKGVTGIDIGNRIREVQIRVVRETLFNIKAA